MLGSLNLTIQARALPIGSESTTGPKGENLNTKILSACHHHRTWFINLQRFNISDYYHVHHIVIRSCRPCSREKVAAYEFSIFSNPWSFRVEKLRKTHFTQQAYNGTSFNIQCSSFLSVLNQFFQNKWLNQKMVPDEWIRGEWMEGRTQKKALGGTEWCQFVSQSVRKFDWKACSSGKFIADASISIQQRNRESGKFEIRFLLLWANREADTLFPSVFTSGSTTRLRLLSGSTAGTKLVSYWQTESSTHIRRRNLLVQWQFAFLGWSTVVHRCRRS